MDPAPRPPLRRRTQGRLVGGVAAGVADHLGMPVPAARLGFVGLALVMGAGVLAYLLLWLVVPPAPAPPGSRAPRGAGVTVTDGRAADGEVTEAADGAATDGTPTAAGRWGRFVPDTETGAWLLWGVVLLVVGLVALADRAGWGLGLATAVPAALAIAGAVLVWTHLDGTVRTRWVAGATGGTPGGGLRLAVGLLLAVTGLLLLALTGTDAAALGPATLATLAVVTGLALLLAPWALRLWRNLESERAARVRETERADIAAHLHDSVLQTLALIQRRSDDPVEVARLARAQERELRGWLYGSRSTSGAASLGAAVEQVVAQVEDDHAVPVEVVVVGDRPLDPAVEALVQAVREATLNAVRHGRPPVRVYVEVADDAVQAFVSDRGDGFDPDDVPPDRLGVRESVVGRMVRAGGSARVRPAPAGGTEVVLELPVRQPAGHEEAR
ncbi:PspC domain-containing protein [Jannaschia sp. R86511]|uniref:ATP-binding protein n=1 Tax=Jannaschia sp. R86511 TaxID=3093853 RepID=UPI0036D301E2